MFDTLKLHHLCPLPLGLSPKSLEKWKGDTIEAVIGELAEAENETPDASMLLTELLAFIAYCGEKAYFDQAAEATPTYSQSSTFFLCTNVNQAASVPQIEEVMYDLEPVKVPKQSAAKSAPKPVVNNKPKASTPSSVPRVKSPETPVSILKREKQQEPLTEVNVTATCDNSKAQQHRPNTVSAFVPPTALKSTLPPKPQQKPSEATPVLASNQSRLNNNPVLVMDKGQPSPTTKRSAMASQPPFKSAAESSNEQTSKSSFRAIPSEPLPTLLTPTAIRLAANFSSNPFTPIPVLTS